MTNPQPFLPPGPKVSNISGIGEGVQVATVEWPDGVALTVEWRWGATYITVDDAEEYQIDHGEPIHIETGYYVCIQQSKDISGINQDAKPDPDTGRRPRMHSAGSESPWYLVARRNPSGWRATVTSAGLNTHGHPATMLYATRDDARMAAAGVLHQLVCGAR